MEKNVRFLQQRAVLRYDTVSCEYEVGTGFPETGGCVDVSGDTTCGLLADQGS